MNNREFMFRKLHSLLGVIPVGLFLIFHLTVNYLATYGAETYDAAVEVIGNLPFKIALELFMIALPILYHAVYGIYIAFTAESSNLVRFGKFRNWMFYLQRITGVITLVYITWHVWTTTFSHYLHDEEVGFSMMVDNMSNPLFLSFYIVGVVSTAFHFANGLWSFFVSWGITVTPKSQKISTYFTLGLFFVLAYIGVAAALAFVDPSMAT
ncbi:MAG: succinate dehydrogenase cytochrome b558 subunit, partial [Bacilli bacterium]